MTPAGDAEPCAAPARRRRRHAARRWLFVWLLPAAWTVVAFFSFQHPGDEYALFFVGSMPGAWIFWIVEDNGSPAELLPLVLGTGAVTLSVVGLLLDLLRVSVRVWLVLAAATAVIVFCTSFGDFPTIRRAVSKHGSIEAYAFFATNLGLVSAAVLMLPLGGVWRLLRRRTRAGDCPKCGYNLTGNTSGRCPECGAAAPAGP